MPASTTASAGFTSGAATSLTISHTSDTNPLYVLLSWFVAFGDIDTTDVVTGIIYNGVALTRGDRTPVAGNTMEWWRLTAPSAGTHNLVITLSSARRIAAGAVNLTGWPSALADHNFVARGAGAAQPPSVTVASVSGGEVVSWIGFNDSSQDITEPAGSTSLWNQEGMGSGSGPTGGDQVSAGTIQAGEAVSTTVTWTASVAEAFGVAAISSTAPSTNNLLTGANHTVQGNDNFVAGSGGTVIGDRNALFSLCDGSPAPSITGEKTFMVCADDIDLEAHVSATLNGSPIVKGPASSTDRGIATWNGTTGDALRNTPGPTVASDGRIANVTDPTAAQDAATKAYVDARVGGGLIPLVTGADPVALVSDGAGRLILIAYTP